MMMVYVLKSNKNALLRIWHRTELKRLCELKVMILLWNSPYLNIRIAMYDDKRKALGKSMTRSAANSSRH